MTQSDALIAGLQSQKRFTLCCTGLRHRQGEGAFYGHCGLDNGLLAACLRNGLFAEVRKGLVIVGTNSTRHGAVGVTRCQQAVRFCQQIRLCHHVNQPIFQGRSRRDRFAASDHGKGIGCRDKAG